MTKSMYTTKIDDTVKKAAEEFKRSVSLFHPWKLGRRNNNITPERTLSFYFCKAFTEQFTNGFSFFESPFTFNGRPARLDAYCISEELALLLEVKQLFDTTEAVRVLNDFDRVCEETARMQAKRHLGKFSPNETRGFILLETTKPVCFNWWMNDKNIDDSNDKNQGDRKKFSQEDTERKIKFREQGWKFNSIEVGKFEVQINARGDSREDTLFWLYAYSPLYHIA